MKAAVCPTPTPVCTSAAPRSIPAARCSCTAPRAVQCRGLLDGFLGGKGGKCRTCKGTGVVVCDQCKGVGRNKTKGGGNIFERYKCYNCQGFGQVKCPQCGSEGLTPEQRGER